jgi:hypothetical protein
MDEQAKINKDVVTKFEAIEDHVWFEDRWMVTSLCDE